MGFNSGFKGLREELLRAFSYIFIFILYMFRAAVCPSSGELIVSIQHLVYVTLCRWPFSVHTKRSSIQSDIYQMSHSYN